MDKVNEVYPNITWILNSKGEIKKENYDACDSLVCGLAYVNINRYGLQDATIKDVIISESENKPTQISYTVSIWDKEYEKEILLYNK